MSVPFDFRVSRALSDAARVGSHAAPVPDEGAHYVLDAMDLLLCERWDRVLRYRVLNLGAILDGGCLVWRMLWPIG